MSPLAGLVLSKDGMVKIMSPLTGLVLSKDGMVKIMSPLPSRKVNLTGFGFV